jgi:hypothetical protein
VKYSRGVFGMGQCIAKCTVTFFYRTAQLVVVVPIQFLLTGTRLIDTIRSNARESSRAQLFKSGVRVYAV